MIQSMKYWLMFFALAMMFLTCSQPVSAQFVQQGSKLIGTGTFGGARQGSSVSLSADGNTALVGGPYDAGGGSVWVYTRSGGVWTQQG